MSYHVNIVGIVLTDISIVLRVANNSEDPKARHSGGNQGEEQKASLNKVKLQFKVQ